MGFAGFFRTDRYDDDRPETKQPRPRTPMKDEYAEAGELPLGSLKAGCGCSDCIKGTAGHNCSLCGCINVHRGVVWPEFILPDGRRWAIPITIVRYHNLCEWRSNTFNGPDCAGPEEEPRFDTYRFDVDLALGIAKIHRIIELEPEEEGGDEFNQPQCKEIYLEWCLSPGCELRCTCPWIFQLSDFRNIRSPRQCSLCVGTLIQSHAHCANLELSETLSIVFPEFPTVAGQYSLTMPLGVSGHIVPDEQVLPIKATDGNIELPVADAAGKVMHVSYLDGAFLDYPYADTSYAFEATTEICIAKGIYISLGECQASEQPKGKLSSIKVLIRAFLEIDDGPSGYIELEWSRTDVEIADIVCGEDIVIPFHEMRDPAAYACPWDPGTIGEDLAAAAWPSLVLRVCPYSDVATSSGYEENQCGGLPPLPCKTPCVWEVYLYDGSGIGIGEPVKAWRIKSRAGCDSSECSCEGEGRCHPILVHSTLGPAEVHGVGHDEETPCAVGPVGEGVVPPDETVFEVSGDVAMGFVLYNVGDYWTGTGTFTGGPCAPQPITLELSFTDGCPQVWYDISAGTYAGDAYTGIVSYDPFDFIVAAIPGCGPFSLTLTEVG